MSVRLSNRRAVRGIVILLSFCLWFSLISIQKVDAATNNLSSETKEKLNAYLKEVKKYYHIPGMAVTVVNSKEELFAETYGDCTSGDQMFFIGSESKSFTALCIMQLYEKGMLDLEDEISKYLPDVSLEKPVTVKQLLNQNSGLGTYQNYQTMKVLKHYNEYQYANINYDLLGKIVEAVSGQSYAEYVKEHILNPIEMHHSTADLEVAKNSEMVPGYRNYFGIPIASKSVYPTEKSWFHVPAGYIASSPKDMGCYLQMYLNGGKTSDGKQILSKENIKKMFYDSILQNTGHNTRYGMGWMGENGNFRHGGRVENYSTFMMLDLGKNIGVSIMYNIDDQLCVNSPLTYEVPINVFNIISGYEYDNVSHSDYLFKHLGIDLIYLLIIIISTILLFLSIKWKKANHKSLLQWIFIVVGHIALPTFLLLLPRLFFATPLWVVRSYFSDFWWIIVISATFLFVAGIIRIYKLVRSRKV